MTVEIGLLIQGAALVVSVIGGVWAMGRRVGAIQVRLDDHLTRIERVVIDLDKLDPLRERVAKLEARLDARDSCGGAS